MISSVTKFGLFVYLDGFAAEGLIPMRYLPNEHFHLNEKQRLLKGRKTGVVFQVGDNVNLVIKDANPINSSITLMLSGFESEHSEEACATTNESEDSPFSFNQSSIQAFYHIFSAFDIEGNSLVPDEDWIGVFRQIGSCSNPIATTEEFCDVIGEEWIVEGEICVGSSQTDDGCGQGQPAGCVRSVPVRRPQ